VKKRSKELLPVLVYFHGGFFHNGGSDFWKPHYFMDEDVLFVTLNFRWAKKRKGESHLSLIQPDHVF
jgi:carboxylesterase type B